jgi:hypothetical protein
MSAQDGSRTTILIGLPSGQLWVRALKIFTNSTVVRFVVGFAVSATTASCFACTVHDVPATHTNISNRRQLVTVLDSKPHPIFAKHDEGNQR